MATTTPNFGWPVPTSTDLVKDGATAIEALGDGIDASLLDLKGGTTGQVLAKASNTDLDYTWSSPNPGDITAVTAGTGITGGGTSGDVTVSFDQSNYGGGQYAAAKNKLINGAMQIDQRNNGATSTASGVFTVDRFEFNASQATKITWGQNYGGVTPPAGFSKYLGFKTTTAVTIGAGDYFFFGQKIEGQNVADLAFGTASAKTITLSFYVYSSLTGTFGGAVGNSAGTRSYPFSYSTAAANTWERKTITIAGDTSGTWLTTNGIGLKLWLGLGVGSTFSGTAGAWAGADYFSATSATSVVGTLNATFYITGAMIEVGSTATPFQTASGSIGGELALCQRYYYRFGGSNNYQYYGIGVGASTTQASIQIYPPVTMRTSPTTIDSSTLCLSDSVSGLISVSSIAADILTPNLQSVVANATGLTQFRFYRLLSNNSTSAFIGFSAEL
jgi:hypothetical protein